MMKEAFDHKYYLITYECPHLLHKWYVRLCESHLVAHTNPNTRKETVKKKNMLERKNQRNALKFICLINLMVCSRCGKNYFHATTTTKNYSYGFCIPCCSTFMWTRMLSRTCSPACYCFFFIYVENSFTWCL